MITKGAHVVVLQPHYNAGRVGVVESIGDTPIPLLVRFAPLDAAFYMESQVQPAQEVPDGRTHY